MAKPPVSDHNTTSDHLQTWILRVYIHCEGCKKKVFKILRSIDGVYKTVIDSKEHKATVTGSVNGETLVQKLLKSGKRAEILPENFKGAQKNATGKPKKKKQGNKQNVDVPTGDETEHVEEENEKSEDAAINVENIHEIAKPPASASGDHNNGGKKKKKKKKKGDKTDSNTPPKESDTTAETTVAIEKAGPEGLNLGPPIDHMVYANIPPYHNNYYPTPAYGVSYSTSNPSTESSYYTPPVYGYSQSHPHPSVYYPPPPLPPYYRRSVFDDHDDEGDGRLCAIM